LLDSKSRKKVAYIGDGWLLSLITMCVILNRKVLLSINAGYEIKEDVAIDIDTKRRTRENKNGNARLVYPLRWKNQRGEDCTEGCLMSSIQTTTIAIKGTQNRAKFFHG
jgi:hypothetical protein